MKSSDHFKSTIQKYLEARSKDDELFAVAYANPKKSIDECITYILNTVQKSGCNGFTDEEVFSMAVHYYDETDIKAGKPIDCKVVVNHTVELTEEDRKQARQEAIKRLAEEQYTSMKKKPARKKENDVQQMTLF
jgi:hypothetical protein